MQPFFSERSFSFQAVSKNKVTNVLQVASLFFKVEVILLYDIF